MRIFAIALFLLFSLAPTALAQVTSGSGTRATSGENTGTTLINPLRGGTLQSFLINILTFVINVGSIIVVLMFVFVGFKFVTAQGNETKVAEAKKMLLWTTIGALVLLGAKVIAEGIQATVQALSGS